MATELEKRVRRLLTLRRIYAPYEGEDAEICQWLKQEAARTGNFQESIAKLGKIKVSAPHDRKFKGKTWVLDVEAFLQAAKPTRDSLLKRGLVKEVDEYSGAYYGSVTVELFS
jgi:hypothetical protein